MFADDGNKIHVDPTNPLYLRFNGTYFSGFLLAQE